MKKNKLCSIFVPVILILPHICTYGQGGEDVRAIAYHSLAVPPLVHNPDHEPKLEDKFRILYLSVFIKNVSGISMRIATKTAHEIISVVGGVDIKLIIEKKENILDIDTVPPECDLGVVELKPGEIVSLDVREVIKIKTPYDNVKVTYCIQQQLADRYNLWQGRLEIKSKLIDANISRTNRDASEPFWFEAKPKTDTKP